jgi:tricorn protease
VDRLHKDDEHLFQGCLPLFCGPAEIVPVTDGLSDASEPVFDPSGDTSISFASTDAGPVINWFDLSSADMRMTNSIYLVTLRKDILSPFAKESDEEKGTEEKARCR